jgi:chromosome segregation ATPase
MGKVSGLVRTVSDFPWVAGPKLAPDGSLEAAARQPNPASPEPAASPGKVTFADVGARIGADNEVLRNLLIDTGHQLSAIDDLKESFAKLTEPLANILTTLEHERAEHARSQGELVALRSGHETLRADFQKLDARSSELKADNERLNKGLATALQKARELEDNRSEMRAALQTARDAINGLTKQLGDESTKVRVLSEEKVLLTERAEASDKRMSELEGELAQTREHISLLENDKHTLQVALDRTLAESSRLSRQLGESESALSQVRGRIQQIESNLAAAEAERDKLAAACDESNERRQSEVYALELKLDAMRSRSETAEQMAASARQSLIGRSEALRAAEARLFEANAARSEAGTKAEHLAALNEQRERQIEKLEHHVTELSERCRSLLQAKTANESALADAQEHVASLTSHVEQLQLETASYRTKAEEDFVQLNAMIEQERTERALVEAALESTRKDYTRLQQQTMQARSVQRTDPQRRPARS